jgi:hypothetical protein
MTYPRPTEPDQARLSWGEFLEAVAVAAVVVVVVVGFVLKTLSEAVAGEGALRAWEGESDLFY